MFPWEHITWMGFVTVITEYRSEGTCLYRKGAFSVSLKNRPRRVFTLNYFMEVSGRCITYFQRAQLWNIWENTVKKPAFFQNAGFFREKRDDFAKIAALNAALFDRTLRFFLPGMSKNPVLVADNNQPVKVNFSDSACGKWQSMPPSPTIRQATSFYLLKFLRSIAYSWPKLVCGSARTSITQFEGARYNTHRVHNFGKNAVLNSPCSVVVSRNALCNPFALTVP